MKNKAPQTSVISKVCPKSGCNTKSAITSSSRASAIAVGRHFRPARGFAEQPSDQDDEGRLDEFRGLDVEPKQYEPAPGAFHFGAKYQSRGQQNHRDDEHRKREPADLLGGKEGSRQHDGDGGDEIEHLPVDEVEGIEAELGRDRRACRQKKHDAGEHQRPDRGQRQPVDRPPPFGEERTLGARNHDSPRASRPSPRPAMVSRGLRSAIFRSRRDQAARGRRSSVAQGWTSMVTWEKGPAGASRCR